MEKHGSQSSLADAPNIENEEEDDLEDGVIVILDSSKAATLKRSCKWSGFKKLPNKVELSLWELQDMATRQQQQIESQQQMLAAKEQRLRYLKHQEARTHQVAAEKDRLRRLKERVEAQELKLRKLRALRGQVDQDKIINNNLTSDLDSIRALFNEKEKELSLAVAKVEELTRQLEELKRSGRGKESHAPASAALELDKLRRELLFRNKLKDQQHLQLSQQREALNQRQEEMTNIDKRITELQDRLHRKRVLNQELTSQLQHTNGNKMAAKQGYQRQNVNVAAVEPYHHVPTSYHQPSATDLIKQHIEDTIKNTAYQKGRRQDENKVAEGKKMEDEKDTLAEFGASKSDPKYQTLPYNTKFQVNYSNYSKGVQNGVAGVQVQQVHSTPITQPSLMSPAVPSHLTPRVFGGPRGQPVGGTPSKPVSSVAPTNIIHKPARSFMTTQSRDATEKPSPIYQTSSTKILPVQPQVLATTPQSVLKESKVELSPPVSTSTPVATPDAPDNRLPKPALPPKPAVPVKPTPPPPPRQTPEAKGYIEITAESLDQALISVSTRLDQQHQQHHHQQQQQQQQVPSKSETPPPPPPPPTSPPPDEGKPDQSIGNNKQIVDVERSGTDEADRAVTSVPGPDLTYPEEKEKECLRDEVEVLNNLNNLNTQHDLITLPGDVIVRRIKKGNLKSTSNRVQGVSRRVSFDPLALLLDASLEGELELVMKTASQVTNPSSANDEGITALHNAICAGHLDIVKFLVEFGCDVNAQDSDGWTPLHCAASCNNLAMVRFLVEHGACIFATTLSDHETAAEKCEEDEEGFDGCSEYLYSIQEKLGILNNGVVYAVYDYTAHNSDELSFKESDKLVILRKGDEVEREWWWTRLHEREGYTPRNLLGLYPRVHPMNKTE